MAQVRSYAQELDPTILYDEGKTIIGALMNVVGHFQGPDGGLQRLTQDHLCAWGLYGLAAAAREADVAHSVLNEHSTKETPTVERRIRASQLAPLHERITVRHELGPTRRNETQPYAIIRSMHACELDRGRLIKYALARRPEYILRDGESASFDRELIHMA